MHTESHSCSSSQHSAFQLGLMLWVHLCEPISHPPEDLAGTHGIGQLILRSNLSWLCCASVLPHFVVVSVMQGVVQYPSESSLPPCGIFILTFDIIWPFSYGPLLWETLAQEILGKQSMSATCQWIFVTCRSLLTSLHTHLLA